MTLENFYIMQLCFQFKNHKWPCYSCPCSPLLLPSVVSITRSASFLLTDGKFAISWLRNSHILYAAETHQAVVASQRPYGMDRPRAGQCSFATIFHNLGKTCTCERGRQKQVSQVTVLGIVAAQCWHCSSKPRTFRKNALLPDSLLHF
ncbi:Uncharacterized protein HZ326_30454 [Fusarium oxysporum f. sp. albedinis]|nr:Uncharacterized protein HZ326_30454 [Fusarium oxysporum f. sp. albedinis]